MGDLGMRIRDDLLTLLAQATTGIFPSPIGACMNRWILLVLAGLLDLAQPALTSAQSRPTATRVPVTIALADQPLRRGAVFEIRREAEGVPYDVILLRRDADAEQLSIALRALMKIRQVRGDVPTSSAVMQTRRHGTRQDARNAFPWAQRVLDDLRTAAPKQLRGVGTLRAVEIWLPRMGQ